MSGSSCSFALLFCPISFGSFLSKGQEYLLRETAWLTSASSNCSPATTQAVSTAAASSVVGATPGRRPNESAQVVFHFRPKGSTPLSRRYSKLLLAAISVVEIIGTQGNRLKLHSKKTPHRNGRQRSQRAWLRGTVQQPLSSSVPGHWRSNLLSADQGILGKLSMIRDWSKEKDTSSFSMLQTVTYQLCGSCAAEAEIKSDSKSMQFHSCLQCDQLQWSIFEGVCAVSAAGVTASAFHNKYPFFLCYMVRFHQGT